MARLPAMGEEAKWAFGLPVAPDFTIPPLWVRRVVILSFGVDPDAPKASGRTDPLKISKLLGSMVGLAEGAEIVLRPDAAAPTTPSSVLLKPLGNPQPNSVKYFATVEVLEHAKDRAWLAKVTNAVSQHWKQKNQHKVIRADLAISSNLPI